MNSKKNKMGSNQELYRICPSKLTKHELEDLYFTVLETNIQLRKTINEQQEKIKLLTNKIQMETSAQKVLLSDERKNCCVFTNLKVKQQKKSIENLKRAQDRTAERIRKLNTHLSGHQNLTISPYAPKYTAKIIKHPPCTHKHQSESTLTVAEKGGRNSKTFDSVEIQTELLRDKLLLLKDTQTEQLKDFVNSNTVQTENCVEHDNTCRNHEIEGQNDILCAENRCRTLMETFKQQINNLVEDLVKTLSRYSTRISRLENEVQEYRNENIHVRRGQAVGKQEVEVSENYLNHLINNLKAAEEHSADLKMQLAIEKRRVAELALLMRDAELQNRMSKRPRGQSLNQDQQVNRKPVEIDAQQENRSWKFNCDSRFPNTNCPPTPHICTTPRTYKHECTSTCSKKNSISLNPSTSMNNNVNNQHLSRNHRTSDDVHDTKKNVDLSNIEKPKKLPDTYNSEYLSNIERKQDAPNCSKQTDDNGIKEMTDLDSTRNAKTSLENDIFYTYTKRDSSSLDIQLEGGKNGDIVTRDKSQLMSNLNVPQCSDPAKDNKTEIVDKSYLNKYQKEIIPDAFKNEDSKSDANSTRKATITSDPEVFRYVEIPDTSSIDVISEANRKRIIEEHKKIQLLSECNGIQTKPDENHLKGLNREKNSRDDFCEYENGQDFNANISRCNSTVLPDTNTCYDSNRDENIHVKLGNNNGMQTHPNELTESVDIDSSENDPVNSKENLSILSETCKNRNKGKPSLLIETLKNINEDQFKTVAELRRQLNDSQKSPHSSKRTNKDSSKPKVERGSNDTSQGTNDFLSARSKFEENITSQQADAGSSIGPQEIEVHRPVKKSPKLLQGGLADYIKSDAGSCSSVSQETLNLLKSKHSSITNNTPDYYSATSNSKVEVPTSNSIADGMQQTTMSNDYQTALPISPTNPKRSLYSEQNKCGLKDIHKECKEIINSEIIDREIKEKPTNVENVPTKEKQVGKHNNITLDGTSRGENEQSYLPPKPDTVVQPTVSWTPMNNLLYKPFKTIDKANHIEVLPEKLETRKSPKEDTSISVPSQREIATYRRDSGTLCFKTVPASKRSQFCQCNEQHHCELVTNKGIQTDLEVEDANKKDQGTCASGYSKCTLMSTAKNMKAEMSNKKSSGTEKRLSRISIASKFDKNLPCGLTNQLKSDKAVPSCALSDRDKYNFEQKNAAHHRFSSIGLYKDASNEDLETMAEELARCKAMLSLRYSTVAENSEKLQNTSENKTSDEVLTDFDAGCQHLLKRGVAMHSMNASCTPKCMFVLHIGTIVLSDEAVLTSRNMSLGLTWKFYDQDSTTTQMRTGRVVVFDFSTEYDLNLTDEFLGYMKHDQLHILICQLNEPNKPFASCALPLRDALLNTNRRVDMSLALVAGPQMIYARQANNAVSDILDAGDEMGVLDLWCMLRAEAQFVPIINKSISVQPANTRLMDPKLEVTGPKDNEKLTGKSDDNLANKWRTASKKSLTKDENSSLRRWGSSVLRLPSREASRVNSLDKQANILSGTQDEVPDSKDEDSSGFKTVNTVDVDLGVMPKKKTFKLGSSNKKSKTKKQNDHAQRPPSTNTAVQYDDNFPDGLIIDEVIANIRTSQDMKRVMNRSSVHRGEIIPDEEVLSYKKESTSQRQLKDLTDLKRAHSQQKVRELLNSRQVTSQEESIPDISEISFLNNITEDGAIEKYKKATTVVPRHSVEPSLLLPSVDRYRNERSYINKQYDNIAKLAKYDSQKREAARRDSSKRQVTINQKQLSKYQEEAQKNEKSIEEEQPTIDVTVLWLALNEECEAMLNPRVQRVYVAYEFLGRSGADLETPVSLPKPKHYVDKCYFNFRKTFLIDKDDMVLLGEMSRNRATSQVSNSPKDCIVFSVISEPPEDPLGLDICEDIGYAYLYLGDLLAYSAGSPGYTEVVPVRSRSDTSVCGVLAVRLDGLDVLRQCLAAVGHSTIPCMD